MRRAKIKNLFFRLFKVSNLLSELVFTWPEVRKELDRVYHTNPTIRDFYDAAEELVRTLKKD